MHDDFSSAYVKQNSNAIFRIANIYTIIYYMELCALFFL